MLILRRFVSGFRRLLDKTQVERDMDEELRAYLEMAVEQKMAAGLTREAAVRAARVEIGSLDAIKEEARDIGWESTVGELLEGRTLRASNVASIARFYGRRRADAGPRHRGQYRDLHAHRRRAAEVAAGPRSGRSGPARRRPELWRGQRHGRVLFGLLPRSLQTSPGDGRVRTASVPSRAPAGAVVSVRHAGSGAAQPAAAKLVSGNYFEVLGVKAAWVAPSPHPMIRRRRRRSRSSAFATGRTGSTGDPSAVGSTVDLNGVSVAIIGVAPPEFHGETLQPDPPSFWLPISADRHLDPERTVIDEPDRTGCISWAG